ncbi:hypothetical protein HCN58_29195 [Bradyrhizobium sp. WSM 1791]|uniref:Uncharacterized protein n=1 Tax=Bradyrhizobium australiense TaxID=2721161 RepID=A0A7Y4LYH3_9BRAD|nr:hypothetical protein [Bradyrhizobium australiense]
MRTTRIYCRPVTWSHQAGSRLYGYPKRLADHFRGSHGVTLELFVAEIRRGLVAPSIRVGAGGTAISSTLLA